MFGEHGFLGQVWLEDEKGLEQRALDEYRYGGGLQRWNEITVQEGK